MIVVAISRGQRHPVHALSKAIRRTIGNSILLSLAFLVSCGEAPTEFPAEFELLTISGATNIERHRLRGIAAKQLNYTVSLDFPKMALDESEFAQLDRRGWTACTGTRNQWDSYFDKVDKANPRCVYRFGKYFVKQTDLMLISLQYQGKPDEKSNCASKPDNSTQLVVVAIYEHKDLESMQLDKLRLSCVR